MSKASGLPRLAGTDSPHLDNVVVPKDDLSTHGRDLILLCLASVNLRVWATWVKALPANGSASENQVPTLSGIIRAYAQSWSFR
jgi:hypothetical protein